jgi:hypothetical protein
MRYETFPALIKYLDYKENTGLLFNSHAPRLTRATETMLGYQFEFDTHPTTFKNLIYPGFHQLCEEHSAVSKVTGIRDDLVPLREGMIRVVIAVWPGDDVGDENGENDFTPV